MGETMLTFIFLMSMVIIPMMLDTISKIKKYSSQNEIEIVNVKDREFIPDYDELRDRIRNFEDLQIKK